MIDDLMDPQEFDEADCEDTKTLPPVPISLPVPTPVRMTRLALIHFLQGRNNQRTGLLLNSWTSNEGEPLVRILRDGYKNPETFHADFWETRFNQTEILNATLNAFTALKDAPLLTSPSDTAAPPTTDIPTPFHSEIKGFP